MAGGWRINTPVTVRVAGVSTSLVTLAETADKWTPVQFNATMVTKAELILPAMMHNAWTQRH